MSFTCKCRPNAVPSGPYVIPISKKPNTQKTKVVIQITTINTGAKNNPKVITASSDPIKTRVHPKRSTKIADTSTPRFSINRLFKLLGLAQGNGALNFNPELIVSRKIIERCMICE